MGQRMIPWDSIPSNAYYEMMQEKMTLQSTAGFYTEDEWTCLGPKPVNSYTTSAGRVSCVAYDRRYSDGSVIYLGSCGGGVWKSTDGGLTWEPKTDGIDALACGSLAIDPNLSSTYSIIYCGTGEGVWFGGAPYSGCGILKSTNEGQDWRLIRNGLPYRTIVYKIVICPTNPNLLFAALQAGLFKSTDAGENWTKALPTSGADRQCTDVAFSTDGNKVSAIGPFDDYFYPGIGGYFVSTNGGSNFTQTFITNYEIRRSKIVVCKNEPQYVFILFDSYDNATCSFLYKSTNAGLSFDNGTKLTGGGGNASYNLMLNVDPDDHLTLYFGLSNLFKSVDGGSSWCCVGSVGYWGCSNPCSSGPTPHPDFHAMDFNPSDPDKIIVGCDGGVYTSTNQGSSWNTNTNATLTLTQFYKFTSFPFNENQLSGGAQDMGMMYKTGDLSWNIPNGGDGANALCSETRPNNMVANMCGSSHATYYSTNGGVTFESSTIPGVTTDATVFVPYVSHPYEPGVFYALRNVGDNQPLIVCKSSDDGLIYSTISQYPISEWAQRIAISKSTPNILYLTTGHSMAEWHTPNRVLKFDESAPPQFQWTDLFNNHTGTIPDKFFSALTIDPLDQNTVYIGLSGFQCDHLWRTTNGGYNWASVSGNLPDGPINDIIIYYSDQYTKNILVATDAGVFTSSNEGNSWQEFGDKLPNALETKLFYNRLQCKLRVSTLGRGVWEIPVRGQIIVKDKLIISSDNGGTNMAEDIVVCSGGKITFIQDPRYNSPKLKFAEGKKIIVHDGGILDFSNANNLLLTSQSGTWGGIEFEGNTCTATLKNITFSNTNTPVTLNGVFATEAQSIDIENCIFNDGPVSINSRGNVTVKNCTFNYSGSYNPFVQGVSSVGSNKIIIQNNTINSNTSLSGTAISVVYGELVSIVNNTVHDAYNAISVSNCDAYIYANTLTHSTPAYSNDGIGVDNCNSPTYSYNSVTGYYVGLKFGNSSPVLLSNSTSNLGSTFGMMAELESSPRMAPLPGGGELIYDAGYNSIITGNKDLEITNLSIPYLDYGLNNFEAGQNDYYIEGDIYDPFFAEYDVRCNNWNVTPTPQKFNVYNYMSPITVVYDPYNCDLAGGGGGDSHPIAEPASESEARKEMTPPPQPIIVDRGNGFYDTIKVVSRSVTVSQDRILFAQGTKEELLGHYSNAVNIFSQLIQSYPHTASSVKALGSILYCFDRNHADSSNYLNLHNQYLTIAQTHITDTALFRVARNLAIKTLVKMKCYPAAITEYENVISNSNDSLEILFAELNIVETYMLMHHGGDAPSFTGKLTYLKPSNIQDGLRMIHAKYHSGNKKTNVKVIPKEFKLSQNYPNPFNPITTISYSLPHDTKVVIKVYDILGRLVKELVNDFKQSGVYEIKFHGSNLASGVYFYKIETDRFTDTKKMVLVK